MPWRKTLHEHYPGALEWPDLLARCNRHLGELGITPANTLFGNVMCRDEINKPDLEAFAASWGENFNLAGLGGYPAAGVTGFTAFHHHVPDGGNLFVLYGPHVGISLQGELGKLERKGMSQKSSACGTLIGLLEKARQKPDYAPRFSPLDPEQHRVEKALHPCLGEVLSSENPLQELTNRMYGIIDKMLHEIIDALDFTGQIVLVGGVMINTPRAEHDDFLPLRANIRNFQGRAGNTHDWLDPLLD